MPEVGDTIEGYRIDALIGRGGMGAVYEATQLSLNRTVALKVITGELSKEPPSASGSGARGCCRRPSSTHTSSPSTRRARASTGCSSRCGSSAART